MDKTFRPVEANLAADEALLIEADEGRAGAVVRAWESPGYAVILGASRRRAEEVHLDRCEADGVPVLRRSSGGGTVLIGPGALNVTVVLPATAAPGLATVEGAQGYVMGRLAEALTRPERPVGVLGSGDLAVDGRKVAGSAQRRLRSWFLVHASILHHFDLDRIERYLKAPPRQPAYRQGRSHGEFLSNLGLPRRIVEASIRAAWMIPPSQASATDVPHHLLESLLSERFANRSWIERF
ncbi:lipoate--protein ligase family protein [Aquisphaera insulae]|uniref:lipoate--protein ligase family protein n=1 Tax=Aquisphaera insulae TaxID=2712864 RepID=UPI0020308F83|nr:lipoate--protein ligase family protein [Aquisphaera insulae]